MNVHRQVFYTGRVQGVGFRYTVKQVAASYEVTGWVRNLADGRVELQVSGEAEEVEAFLEAIQESHLRSYIKEIAAHNADPGHHGHTGFTIRD